MKNDYYFHGSDIEKIKEKYKIKNEEIINFAANVNPLGISPQLKAELSNHMDIITTYPDRNYTSLKKSIADYVGTNTENFLVGNGTSELISLFIEIINPKKAMIIGPIIGYRQSNIPFSGLHNVFMLWLHSIFLHPSGGPQNLYSHQNSNKYDKYSCSNIIYLMNPLLLHSGSFLATTIASGLHGH